MILNKIAPSRPVLIGLEIESKDDPAFYPNFFSQGGIEKNRIDLDTNELMTQSFESVKISIDYFSKRKSHPKVKIQIFPSDDLTLSKSMSFVLSFPEGYPFVPPDVKCVTNSPDVKKCPFINGKDVTCLLLTKDLPFWSKSYKLDVVVHSLRQIFLKPNIEPWEQCFNIKTGFSENKSDCYSTCGFEFSSIGCRRRMEDSSIVKDNFLCLDEDKKIVSSCYAIFDGHGGDKCSKFSASVYTSELESSIVKSPDNKSIDWPKTMTKSLWEIDRKFYKEYGGLGRTGSTALCVVFDGYNKLYTANLGDSRAVLCSGGTAFDLSKDCKAKRADEISRITSLGGNIEKGRIRGQLAVSRSLGDACYKVKGRMLVSNDAEISEFQITKNDSFIILACDGLWDVMSSQDAVNFVLDRMDNSEKFDPNQITEELVHHSINVLNSTDNVSVIIVYINPLEVANISSFKNEVGHDQSC